MFLLQILTNVKKTMEVVHTIALTPRDRTTVCVPLDTHLSLEKTPASVKVCVLTIKHHALSLLAVLYKLLRFCSTANQRIEITTLFCIYHQCSSILCYHTLEFY